MSYQVVKVESGQVPRGRRQRPAPDAPVLARRGARRTNELSEEVSRLRQDVADRLTIRRPHSVAGGHHRSERARRASDRRIPRRDARDPCTIPTQEVPVCSSGSSTKRAECSWCCTRRSQPNQPRLGLALRKRFCRSFNFELQAAATEDAIILSLGPQHSFRSRRFPVTSSPRPRSTCWCRRCSTRRSSERAGAGTRRGAARRAAVPGRPESPDTLAAHGG